MVSEAAIARKSVYVEKLQRLLKEYTNMLLVTVDHVGSNQMQQVRMALRGRAEILMGKNTLIRKVIRGVAEEDERYGDLLPFIKGNMGFVFTNDNLNDVRKKILEFKVPAAAKSGVIAPVDVIVPAGPTGLDPGQTSFFQALNISTKINRGSIEIIAPVHLIRKQEKVSASAVALLGKLNIKPFFFGIQVDTVWENGSIYSADVLDLDENDLLSKFFNGVRKLAAICLAAGYPTAASVPQSMMNAFKRILAIALETEYTFDAATAWQEKAAASASASGGGDDGAAAGGDAAAAAPVEEEEEEEEAAAADLFGDDEDY